MTHQPAISSSITFQHPLNRAGGRTFDVLPKNFTTMPKLLCKTIEAFRIEGRGTIVVLQDPEEWRIPATEHVKRREAIRILRPDKSSVKTFIKDFEFIRKFASGSGLLIQLPNDVSVEDVPPDSLVFLEREDDEPILWDGRKAEFSEAEAASSNH